jgi:hypothetical protein
MSPIQLGRLIVLSGLILVGIGLLVWSGALNWFGRLPGDIRIERPGLRVHIPWVSLLVVSVALNLLIWLVKRGLR